MKSLFSAGVPLAWIVLLTYWMSAAHLLDECCSLTSRVTLTYRNSRSRAWIVPLDCLDLDVRLREEKRSLSDRASRMLSSLPGFVFHSLLQGEWREFVLAEGQTNQYLC